MPKEVKRTRYICVTLYDDEGNIEIGDKTKKIFESLYTESGAEYAYGAVETCPSTGKKHIQGFLRYKNQRKSYNALQLIYPRGSYKLSSSEDPFADNLFYCSKEQKNSDNILEFGRRTNQGKRTDLLEARDSLVQHGLDRVITDHPDTFIKYHKGIYALDRELK